MPNSDERVPVYLEKGRDDLISGIQNEARQEAEKIVADARAQGVQRVKQAETRAQSILTDAGEKARDRAESERKRILSGLNVEINRYHLQCREHLLREIRDRSVGLLSKMVHDSGYRDILLGWIVEAAVGLGADSAFVNTSASELPLIDPRLLREAEGEIKRITGKSVGLSLSQDRPLTDQGVELISADGRTAFNNQVSKRIARNESRIREMIYSAVEGF